MKDCWSYLDIFISFFYQISTDVLIILKKFLIILQNQVICLCVCLQGIIQQKHVYFWLTNGVTSATKLASPRLARRGAQDTHIRKSTVKNKNLG